MKQIKNCHCVPCLTRDLPQSPANHSAFNHEIAAQGRNDGKHSCFLTWGWAVFALLLFLLPACDSFLDEQPISEIPAGNMWANARDAKAGVNEIYGLFRTAMRENYWYWGEFRSDNMSPGAPYATTQERVIRNLLTTDLTCTQWTDLYRMINQTNLCIRYLPDIDMPSVADRSDLLGQAYAMRALGYLYAVRVWGDVPLFTEPVELYSQEIYKPRTEKSKIFQQIISDLKMAEKLVSRTNNKERKRISIFGVWAIMADAYSWMEEYNNADQTIDKIRTTNTAFVAFEPSIDTWRKMFVEELNNKASDNSASTDEYATKEFILVIHFNMEEVGANGYSNIYQWFSSGSGARAATLSDKFIGLVNNLDKRKPLITTYYQEGWELRKFVTGNVSSTLNKICEVAYPVYRFSDMLLLQAECKVHLGKWEEALDLVKQVRTRAGLPTLTAQDFVSKEELIDYILTERQIELVGEGRRWFDLLRTHTWKTVMEPVNGMKEDGNEVFPIYFLHIRQNPNLTQNPYYGGQ